MKSHKLTTRYVKGFNNGNTDSYGSPLLSIGRYRESLGEYNRCYPLLSL